MRHLDAEASATITVPVTRVGLVNDVCDQPRAGWIAVRIPFDRGLIMMKCKDVQSRLRTMLPGWEIKIGARLAVLTTPRGDELKMVDWRLGDPNGERLYREALRFEQQMMQEKRWNEDSVIKELLRQIQARKMHLAQAEPEVAAGHQPI